MRQDVRAGKGAHVSDTRKLYIAYSACLCELQLLFLHTLSSFKRFILLLCRYGVRCALMGGLHLAVLHNEVNNSTFGQAMLLDQL